MAESSKSYPVDLHHVALVVTMCMLMTGLALDVFLNQIIIGETFTFHRITSDNYYFYKFLSGTIALTFFLVGILPCRYLLRLKCGIELSSKGLNVAFLTTRPVTWNDITYVNVRKVGRNDYVEFGVKETEPYRSFWTRPQPTENSSFLIPLSFFKVDKIELQQSIRDFAGLHSI